MVVAKPNSIMKFMSKNLGEGMDNNNACSKGSAGIAVAVRSVVLLIRSILTERATAATFLEINSKNHYYVNIRISIVELLRQ